MSPAEAAGAPLPWPVNVSQAYDRLSAAASFALRDVRIDPSGVLYVLTDGPEGTLYRLNRGTGEEDKEKTHL